MEDVLDVGVLVVSVLTVGCEEGDDNVLVNLDFLVDFAAVGIPRGLLLGFAVGPSVAVSSSPDEISEAVGLEVETLIGFKLGCLLGLELGDFVVGPIVGGAEGLFVGEELGEFLGLRVGIAVGGAEGLIVGLMG